jgi:putative transposase
VKPQRENSRPGTYFITSKTLGARSLFQVERNARLFLHVLYSHERAGRYLLHEFVLMPDHFHVILTPCVSLEKCVQLIKGGFAHEIGRPVWQRGFTDHRIRDVDDFDRHRQYVRLNPVNRGLVGQAEEYRYSSAYPGYRLAEPSLRG